MEDDTATKQVWIDIFRYLPTTNLVCSVRLAHPKLLQLVDSEAATNSIWIERRNYLLTHVEPQEYPRSIIERGWVSIEWPQIVEPNDNACSNDVEVPQSSSIVPKVRIVKPLNKEICQEFVKSAYQKWHIEYVLRSWRKKYLQTVGPLADFWDSKWNERENAEIYGTSSDDPLVANSQVDIEEMCRNLYEARRSTLLRVQDDETDKEREKRFFRERTNKKLKQQQQQQQQ